MVEIKENATVPPVVIEATISDTFGHGWETLKKYFPEMLLILCLLILFSLPMGLVNAFADQKSFGYIFFTIFNIAYGLIILAPLSYGANWLYLRAVRGEPFKVQEIFDAYRQTLQIILARVLVSMVVGIGIVMLIVPGIIFACRLSMVSYLIMERKLEAVEAVRTSWEMTRGHSWTIFGFGIVSIFVVLGGLILLIVGIIPAIMWISLGFAAMYHAISSQKDKNRDHQMTM
jgi:uncharacterized membrane protein